ncbi:molybdenum ABC transporter ATP-binding protein [Nitrincola iocasae]|uniref:Molybdenum ABC transporter ATP-binding protein n=1 Tax=Nitrincola iocasae TaxID=2614693 RepID=A0A5J6L8Z0_9GAMM|nr:molybdenum ABC transporter ATP-binding protein [Nitrincola iocasae]QEW05064.1 molybdenum ABC transporter ATP-binding protein [Nitrincola iocasae]
MSLAMSFQVNRAEFQLQVSLELPDQGVTALFGRSGSGKTTLLRCIAGLEQLPGGSLSFQGQVWQSADEFVPVHLRPIGYVFQEASLFPHLTIEQNLHYGFKRIRAAERRIGFDEVVELLSLQDYLTRYPDQLSGGQRQRVSIGRALLTSPRLLLMDEPMASLDATSKQEILPYLERLTEELQLPIIYVSHAVDEVMRLADYMVLLDQGQVQAQGPLQALLTDHQLPFARSEQAASLLKAQLVDTDAGDGLAGLQLEQQPLLISQTHLSPGRLSPITLGATVKVTIMARDVVLARQLPEAISLLNALLVRVVALDTDLDKSQVLVHLQLGEQALMARISKRSAGLLQLQPGQQVYALIKGVAVNS